MSFSKSAAGGGTSIFSAETATGWHVIKVEGFSKIKGSFDAGMGINYGKFSVGGLTWSVRLYPDGFGQNYADWVSFGLCYLNHTEEVPACLRARYRVSLLDKDGEPVPSYTRSSSKRHTFWSGAESWNLADFIRRKDLESTYLTNDSFCIRCDITVIVKEIWEECMVPQSDLNQHLGDLLDSEVGGDVTFEVGSEAFVAHKYVLAARSSVFKAEFFGGPMKEKAASRVRVEGIEARVFKAMLHFIYTDSLPDFDSGDKMVMAQHLLVAADRYNIGRLKLICENMLFTFINPSIVATTLVLAEHHGFHRLKKACFKFLKSIDNFKAVQGDDYKHLMRSCPSLFEELLGTWAWPVISSM